MACRLMSISRSNGANAVRSILLFFALLLMFGLGRPAGAMEPSTDASSLDHILLWGRNLDQVTAIMAVKLGFQVRPGRDPGGVANRYVRMADRSYLELEGITRPDADMDPGMQADQAVLRGGPGARTFGLRLSALDQARAFLQHQGLEPTAIFSASPTDPDGAGPSAPARWRLFAFNRQPLSSNLFFIDYAPGNITPASVADDQIAHEHPNTARELSALWLLSADADADRKQFERMGYMGATSVRIPQISARGYAVPMGSKRIFVLQPDGAGIAAEALRKGGSQVLGVSIGVADFDAAKRRVERGYETQLTSYCGLQGESFLAPTQGDLGLLIEFHALSVPAASAGHCN
ncbi:VOC family protein [Rhodanobacter glycinis]|uniref:VOC family protein n=1 Tax=Rhodanobacter glycinis TaxID=582702 RepID=UPI001F00C640|nr:VOC family protein [Rhodanobacter glycinis]